MDKIWYLPPPTEDVHGDFGPYSVKELKAARKDLIKFVHESNGAVFQRVKAKCGILADGRRKISGLDMGNVPVDLEGAVSADDLNGSGSDVGGDVRTHGVKRKAEIPGSTQPNKKQAVDKKIIAYTCDLCDFTTEIYDEVVKHLQQKNHFSASMCHSSKENSVLIPKTLLKPLVVTNRSARFNNVIPTCPKCFAVYENINICNLHYQNTHEDNSDIYSLSTVKETLWPKISSKNQCLNCGKNFAKTKSLHDHWRSAKHFPLREPMSDEIRIMFCPHCERLFYDFFSCKEHIRHVHVDEIGSHAYSMKVLYLEKPTTQCHLLPSSPATTKNLVNKEIKMLTEMRKAAKKTANSKHTVKAIRENIKLYKHYRKNC
ncbi:uncharacterized protein LOC126822236 [Patella vulgata]|uniref:uncharacterized protein LOC126822236 n=1 Tax=Patella vulgata TaxID=6465 RepID=UPI00217F922F|nr:uncharacterized protein LOC126822236 [Patella vulgata]